MNMRLKSILLAGGLGLAMASGASAASHDIGIGGLHTTFNSATGALTISATVADGNVFKYDSGANETGTFTFSGIFHQEGATTTWDLNAGTASLTLSIAQATLSLDPSSVIVVPSQYYSDAAPSIDVMFTNFDLDSQLVHSNIEIAGNLSGTPQVDVTYSAPTAVPLPNSALGAMGLFAGLGILHLRRARRAV